MMLLPLRPSLCALRSVAFSRDGRMSLSGGYDKTLKHWDVSE